MPHGPGEGSTYSDVHHKKAHQTKKDDKVHNDPPGWGKPKKKRRPRRGGTGHGTHPKRPPNPLNQGIPAPPIDKARRDAERAQAKAQRWIVAHSKRNQAIKQRQAILKSAGYHITVDGHWGMSSQHAWRDFITRRAHGDKTLGAPYAIPKGKLPNAPVQIKQAAAFARRNAASLESKRAAAAFAKEQAAMKRNNKEQRKREELAKQRFQIHQLARQLEQNANAAKTLTLRELTDALVDPQVGVGVTTHAGALALQTWLNSHGYHVARSGAYNKATHEALSRALADEQQRVFQEQNRQIINYLYRPNHLRAGEDKPAWLAELPGHKVPTPAELQRMLSKGGFGVHVAFNQLLEHAKDGNWTRFQHDQLMRIAGAIQPFATIGDGIGPGVSNDFLTTQLLLSIPQTQMSPYGHGYKYGDREEAKRRADLIAQVTALHNAKNPGDFKRKLSAYTAVQEQIALREEQTHAGHSLGFFGKAMHAMVAESQFFQTSLMVDTHLLLGSIPGFGSGPGYLDYIRMSDDQRAAVWQRAVDAQDSANPILHFTYQIFADPIWLAKPFKVASSLIRYAGDAGILGERVGLTAGKFGRYAVGADGLLAKGYRANSHIYEAGTWTKTGIVAATSRATLGKIAPSVHGKLADYAEASLALKGDMLDEVRRKVALEMRHGFTRPAVALAGKAGKQMERYAVKAPLAKKLLERRTAIKALHDFDPSGDLQVIYGELSKNKASLYMDLNREEYSPLGAAYLARFSEAYRVHIGRRIALDSARDVADAMRREAEAVAKHHSVTFAESGAPEGGRIEAYRAALHNAGLTQEHVDAAVQAEFQRVMHEIGSFVAGGESRQTATREGERIVIHDVLRKAVSARMDELENSLFLTWQEMLEQDALTAGHNLWDDKGLWVDRESEQVKNLAQLVTDSFANPEKIDNPLWNVGLTWIEASEAIESEIRRLSARAVGLAKRQEVGELPKTFDLNEKLAAIRKDVEGHWKKNIEDGKWYDDRPQLDVSALYARHIESAVTPKSLHGSKGAMSVLDQLAAFPGDVVSSANSQLDHAIEHLTWRLGGRSQFVRLGARIHPADTRHLLAHLSEEEAAFTAELSGAIADHQDALAEAYDQITPRVMNEKLAFWQAMAHAQSAPLHYLYTGIHAGLQLWITATLPLRPAWVVRNVIDNFSKVLIAGINDPRILFLGAEHPGSGIRTVFDFGVDNILHVTRFLDGLFGTDVAPHLETLLAHFWELPASVLRKVFDAHGIEVDEAAIQGIKQDYIPGKTKIGGRPHAPQRDEFGEVIPPEEDGRFKKSLDALYGLMGNRPENYFKRVLYRDTVKSETYRLKGLDAYKNTKALEDREWTVKIDNDEARRLLEKYTGHAADDIDVVFEKVPRDVMMERGLQATGRRGTIRYGGYKHWNDLEDMRAGVQKVGGNPEKLKHRIIVSIPDDVKIRTMQEADHAAEFFGQTFLHELRHAVQFERRSMALDKAVSKRLPYKWKPMEIDARAFARLKRKVGRDIFTNDSTLPSYWNDAEIAREAHRLAMEKIAATLFDYSKVTVLEDNLRVFFPFIQFWRKNLGFWVTNALDKPWLISSYAKWEADMQNAHSDLPEWMRRYVHSDELVDAASVVPGLAPIVSAIIPDNAQYDPLKYSSGAPIYRTFLDIMGGQGNELLPPSDPGKNGWPIIGPMLDTITTWGLGMNPLIEKPLEGVGVASTKSWQTIFPQAGPLIAFQPEFWLEHSKNRVVDWARIATLYALTGSDGDGIAKNYDYYINAEIAGQVARGEKPDREKATKLIQDWFWTQNMVGYFTGAYLRRATQQDIYLSQLQDQALQAYEAKQKPKFTDKQYELLRLWGMRGASPLAFDKYLQNLPKIKAYYRQPDYAASQAYLDQHPELTQYVDPNWRGKPFSENYMKQVNLHYQADTFFRIVQLEDTLDVNHDIRQATEQMLLTPAIKAMWDENATPAERQRRWLQGLVHKQLNEVNDAYFSIPESNDEARRDFLKRHPELIRMWNSNNNAADDYEAILHDANAELRDHFFNLIDHGHHKRADDFLRQHPFLWEDTKHANHFDPHTGQLKLQYMSAKARAYIEAKPGFDKLDAMIHKVGRKAAWNWLYNSEDPDARAAREYIKLYGKHGGGGRSQHAIDYLAVRDILKAYFAMPKDVRERWLHGDSEEAKQLRAYFAKWANDKGMTQHAKDYLAAKSALDHYFSLSKSARRAWLKSNDPDARKVLAYFKKYGTTHKYERAYARLNPGDVGGTPEQRMRLLFWKRYFALSPDKRPAFIHDHAEQYGIFVYGPLSQKSRDEREQAWLRRAHGAHFTPRQLDYLYVKPLLDFYFSLKSSSEKRLFMQANPELAAYFASHPPHVHTGNPKLDAEVEAYFKLDVTLRSDYLRQHPEVQKWLDTKSSPADRAIHALLSQYFALTGRAKSDFAAEHPEIGQFFAARLLEQANLSAATQALYEADPRLAPYRNNVADMIGSANRQLDRLRAAAEASFTPDTIEANRDRTTKYTGHSTGRHRQKKAKANIAPDNRARG